MEIESLAGWKTLQETGLVQPSVNTENYMNVTASYRKIEISFMLGYAMIVGQLVDSW